MKRVVSGEEPSVLSAFRAANPGGTWDQFKNEAAGNNQVFDSLATAQGYICAYCEIDLGESPYRQVEHFQPKSVSSPDRNLHLDYTNLLACCEGGTLPWNKERTEKPILATMHCGALKAERLPSGRMLDPRTIPPSRSLWRMTRGELSVDRDACSATGVDPRLAESTLSFLGLNRRVLVRLREVLIVSLDQEAQDGLLSDAELVARMHHIAARDLLPDQDGHLSKFWSTIRAWVGPAIEPFLADNAARIPGLG